MRITNRPRWAAVTLALATAATALALVAQPSIAGATDAPPVSGTACPDASGVTVVVDYQGLGGDVAVGCADGAQTNGFAALTGAGFTFNEDPGAPSGSLCQISRKPAEGYPYCWYEGYWSYWRSNGTAEWGFASTGPAGGGPLAAGTVEGWSWDGPGPGDGTAPRLAIADLDEHLPDPADCSVTPQVPTFDIVDDDEVLPVTLADGRPVTVAVIEGDAPAAQATWAEADEVDLAGRSGKVRVLARRSGNECPDASTFDATYDVRAAYAPRWNQVTDGAPSPAVDKASPSFVGFATGHSSYTPGANVNDSYKTPVNAYGPIDSSLVVLGDRGSITMTFAAPITDGDGYDFAVFENGFASGAADYLELGYLEVSSNGTDFVRFDSASRRASPVASFGTQLASELGGVGGKDLTGKGTPFDLTLLANKDAVRSGAVDLDRITHVRVQDIQGDGNDLDAFGRPIYDPDPLTGSAGFDLSGIGVLNQRDVIAPVVDITAAPTGTVPADDAVVEFTVDDATATVESRLDGGSWSPATSPIEFEGLADGDHTVDVRATDATGNQGADAATWSVDVPLPSSPDQAWALAATTDFIGRAPTTSEFGAIVDRLGSGTSRTVVARELTAGDAWIEAIVTGLYLDTLGRTPDAGGLAYWVGTIRSGSRSVASVASAFYASGEYYRTIGGGTDAGWVTDLYRKVLDREPDPDGLAHWVSVTSSLGRQHVAGAMYGSAESRRDRVRGLYERLLARQPDPSGLSYWSGRIARDGDLALAVHLATSAEYGRRALVRFPDDHSWPDS